MTDYKVIYLAPPCYGDERMWCEHDAPDDCECIDGPHPWIKYIAALRQPTQSDALVTALRFYAREANYRSTTVYMSGQSGKTAIGIDGGQRARTALQEQIK